MSKNWKAVTIDKRLGYPNSRYFEHKLTGARLYGSSYKKDNLKGCYRDNVSEWRVYEKSAHEPIVVKRLREDAFKSYESILKARQK